MNDSSTHFPTTFSDTLQFVEPPLGSLGDQSLQNLTDKGYLVAVGLTRELAPQVIAAAKQHHISDYFCQKDPTEARFASMESTEAWLSRDGGRAMFLLLSHENDQYILNGYGWAGTKHISELPHHPITLATRITEVGLGKRLSKDFLQVIISGAHALFAPNNGLSLVTFDSNAAAKKGYTDLGFVLEATGAWEAMPNKDPTTPGGTMDRRLYMSYPQALLEQ